MEKKSNLAILADNVWPKHGENEDRIELQLQLGYILDDYLHGYDKTSNFRKKIILVSNARYVFEPFVLGSKVFEENCPVTNCFITTNRKTYQRTADALILALPQEVAQLKPKPHKQVTDKATYK